MPAHSARRSVESAKLSSCVLVFLDNRQPLLEVIVEPLGKCLAPGSCNGPNAAEKAADCQQDGEYDPDLQQGSTYNKVRPTTTPSPWRAFRLLGSRPHPLSLESASAEFAATIQAAPKSA